MDQFDELIQFLAPEGRKDVKSAACMTVAQLTGTSDGILLLISKPAILSAVVHLIRDEETFTAKDAMRTLVNVSAEENGAGVLLSLRDVDIVAEMVKCIVDEEYSHADFACGVLSNLSMSKQHCQKVYNLVNEGPTKLGGLMDVFCQIEYNKKGAKMHLLAPVITNFSQLADGRKQIVDKNSFIFQRLLSFMDYQPCKGRRISTVATIHNCCFDKDQHPWLMGEEVDMVPRLLMPLAGPDTFTEEENDSLPIDLQFLPDDKKREPETEIRKLVLEALMQLCVTREGRELMRKQNAYLILREHHKWEEDRQCIMLNEDIVNLLVRTEEEIGVDDLSTVDVTSELAEKFIKQDQEYLASGSSDLNMIENKEPCKEVQEHL